MHNTIDDELEVIADFIARGVSLVPQTITSDGRKVPPSGFKYKKEGHKIQSVDEARGWMEKDYFISIYLHTANAVQIDIDCPLPMDEQDCTDMGCETLEDYVKAKKEAWKKFGDGPRYQILKSVEAFAYSSRVPPHASLASSSGKGLHMYYRCDGDMPANMPADNIEIYTQIRLGLVANWKEMATFFDGDPLPYDDVCKFWANHSRKLAPIAKSKTIKKRSPASVTKDGIIMTGRNTYLFKSACQAFRYGDEQALHECIEIALNSGLDDTEVMNTIRSANNTTDNPPSAQKLLARKEGRLTI